MGQYYIIANLDRCEYLWPGTFGESGKLLEFGSVGSGMLCALAILLADGNGRGAGDLPSAAPCVGRWAGDRVVVSGDYADDLPGSDVNLYSAARSDAGWRNISEEAIRAMCDDESLKEQLRRGMEWTVEHEGDQYGADIPEERLKAWQRERDLIPDAIPGPRTKAAARDAEPDRPAPPPDPDDTTMFEVEG
jgi:hypothetical protein